MGRPRAWGVRALLLLAVALLLAGCTAKEPLAPLRGETPAPDPYYKEHRAIISGQHDEEYPVPVEAGAREVNVTLALDARTQGLPVPEAAPARVRLEILDGAGARLGEATLDADQPTASLVLELAAGDYVARVSGVGASQAVQGEDYGAGYLLSVEVLYG